MAISKETIVTVVYLLFKKNFVMIYLMFGHIYKLFTNTKYSSPHYDAYNFWSSIHYDYSHNLIDHGYVR